MEKPVYELNIVEVRSTVSNAELRLLTRGKLVVSIASKRKPAELILEGRVMTRATCEIFQVTCRMKSVNWLNLYIGDWVGGWMDGWMDFQCAVKG